MQVGCLLSGQRDSGARIEIDKINVEGAIKEE